MVKRKVIVFLPAYNAFSYPEIKYGCDKREGCLHMQRCFDGLI